MTRSGPFATCRVDEDLIARALSRLRRRDLRVWAGAPHWIENSGVDGAGRLVRGSDHGVTPVGEISGSVGSALYGYGAPAWSPLSDDRAVVLTSHPTGVRAISHDGREWAGSALGGDAAGYVCPMGDLVATLVDRGRGCGRAILVGSPGDEFVVAHETDNLVSDVVVSSDGGRAAWIEWPVGTMAWDAGSLRVATTNSGSEWHVEAVDLGGPCAQPVFTEGGLVVDVERGEWFHPHVVDRGRATRLDLPDADYRPDWSLGHAWAASNHDAAIYCAARASRSHQWIVRGGVTADLADGPEYLYDVAEDSDGFFALGSSTTERGVLWHVANREDRWRRVGAERVERRWSGRPEWRDTPSGVPYLWYWPDVDSSFTPTDRPGLVVVVHGGPTRYASFEFSWVIELICRSGFAVASVDHRGSTSYGRTHRAALNGHWGDFDVADVTSVLTTVVTSGDVDPRRVVVRGTSAGAMSALLAAGASDAAGVVVVSPVTDPLALFGSTSDFDCEYARHLTGGEDRALARSPMSVIDSLPSHALVIHGARDDIVPVEQTRSFVAALQDRNRNVTYVELEGEGHSFRRADSGRRAHRAEADFYESLGQS